MSEQPSESESGGGGLIVIIGVGVAVVRIGLEIRDHVSSWWMILLLLVLVVTLPFVPPVLRRVATNRRWAWLFVPWLIVESTVVFFYFRNVKEPEKGMQDFGVLFLTTMALIVPAVFLIAYIAFTAQFLKAAKDPNSPEAKVMREQPLAVLYTLHLMGKNVSRTTQEQLHDRHLH